MKTQIDNIQKGMFDITLFPCPKCETTVEFGTDGREAYYCAKCKIYYPHIGFSSFRAIQSELAGNSIAYLEERSKREGKPPLVRCACSQNARGVIK